jgi:hypothetical protein
VATPIRRCWDLSEAHLREAIASRQAMGRLLKEMAEAARPEAGAAKILLAVARLAKPSCDWIEGSLRVEIDAFDRTKTRIGIIEDLGGGVRELLFPRLVLDAPLEEFARSLKMGPRAVEPLLLQKSTDGDRLVLTHKKARPSHKPPSFELAEDCLRQTLSPAARKTIPPVAAAAPKRRPSARPAPEPKVKSREPLAPAKRRSRAPAERGDPFPMMEIPRQPKVLDFGDLLPSPPPARKASSERPPAKPKKPSRLPPRG